jgi:hypothetical protein
MINMKKLFSVFTFAFALAGLLTSAQALLLPVAEDTSSTPAGQITATTGKAVTLSVTPKQKAYLIFDLSSLPSSLTASNLSAARLNLYVSSLTASGALTVQMVTNDWQEATRSQTAPGVSATVIGTIPAGDVVAKTFIEVDVTSAVFNWLNGASNFGLAIATTSGNLRLASKEGLGTGFPAMLEIERYASAGELDASELTNGTLPLSSLPAAVVTNDATGVSLTGAFSGTGTNLTGVALLQASNTFAKYQTFSNGVAIGYQGASPAQVFTQEALYINSSNSIGAIIGMNGTNAGGHYYEIVSAGSGAAQPAGAFGIFDYTTSAYRLSINSNGNTGIGTVTPAARLEVNGSAKIDGTISGNAAGLTHTFNGATNAVIVGTTAGVTNTSTNYGTLKLVASGATFSNFDSGGNWVDATTNFTGTVFIPVGPGAGVQSGSNDLVSSSVIFQ